MNNELYHFGIPGMKWGVRRQAKKEYKRREAAAFKEYENTIAKIEKPYKRFQNLSKKDQARESAAEAKYNKTVANAKADYKKAIGSGSKASKVVLAAMGGVAISSLAVAGGVAYKVNKMFK